MSLVDQLKSDGFEDQAGILESATKMVCTTGWEWLGELGIRVKKVQSMGPYPEDLNKKLSIILKTTKSKTPYG
ncbi:MAG: hypothetical protein VYA55_06955 [Pseudomonadota bacterium]|nr:hypothetical protein [Pseudomonadota bacterium]